MVTMMLLCTVLLKPETRQENALAPADGNWGTYQRLRVFCILFCSRKDGTIIEKKVSISQ